MVNGWLCLFSFLFFSFLFFPPHSPRVDFAYVRRRGIVGWNRVAGGLLENFGMHVFNFFSIFSFVLL